MTLRIALPDWKTILEKEAATVSTTTIDTSAAADATPLDPDAAYELIERRRREGAPSPDLSQPGHGPGHQLVTAPEEAPAQVEGAPAAWVLGPPHAAEMSPVDWVAVPDNPRQRDTEGRLARAKHLMTPHPAHACVALAEGPPGADGAPTYWKIDGHTRALAWARGLVQPPPRLTVTVFAVSGPEEAADIYDTFDNKAAVDTTADLVYGALREQAFVARSAVMRASKFVFSLRMASQVWGSERGEDTRHAAPHILVRKWIDEIRWLDAFNPPRTKFPGAVLTTALVSRRKRGDRLDAFWKAYIQGLGDKRGRVLDPVTAFTVIVSNERRHNKGRRSMSAENLEVVGKLLACTEGYLEKKEYTLTPRPLSFAEYRAKP